MGQQPATLRTLAGRGPEITGAVRAILPEPLAGITLLARGSSDHAAVYGRYLLEMSARRPASLAAPSIHTIFGAAVDYRGHLAVALSQSGRTPEVVRVLEMMRARGARTIALVNDADSPLCAAADFVIDVGAGREDAVPATKTFTATLLAVALLAEAVGVAPWPPGAVQTLPDHVAAVLEDSAAVAGVVTALGECDRVLVTARGPMLVAALETALKIRETTMVLAEGMSSADLRHGPIVAVGHGFPVIAMAGALTAPDVAGVTDTLRRRGAAVVSVSDRTGADIALPGGVAETLLPVLAAVRGQQLAAGMASQRGLDADRPGGLSKVTLTH